MGDDFLPPDPGSWGENTAFTPPDFDRWESEWESDTDDVEDIDSDADDPDPEPALTAAEQAAQARRLEQWVDEYLDLLPRIEAAKPLPAQEVSEGELRGAERVAESVRQFLAARKQQLVFTVGIRGDAIVADVDVVGETRKQAYGEWLAGGLRDRGHCGNFEVHVRASDQHILLLRRGVTGPGGAWRAAGAQAGKFFTDPAARAKVFELAKLHQTRKSDGRKRYPTVAVWGEDDRGGTVELRLLEGHTLAKAQSAEGALRQALNAPDLVVDSVGVHPLIRLNTRPLVREFPKQNPLRPELFVRPRTQAERHVAASDFVLPLGVRADGSPILVHQDRVPHLGVFGGTGAGKTVLLTMIVQAAILQGGEVILADAKNGKDIRRLAFAGLPGVVHYSVCEAGLHRAVLYAREELARRQQLAAALQAKGIEYRPTPLLLVFDEAPAWINDRARASNPKPVRDAAGAVVGHLSYIASQAREHRIFLLTAGQFAYVSAFAGEWKTNTSTLVILGPPSEINRQALFEGEKRGQVSDLGNLITKEHKGRGLVADQETGKVELFQGFYNPPSDADAFQHAVMQAPKLRRFAWGFPLPGEEGGDGSWQEWTPATVPASDDLPTVYLDGPDGNPLPDLAIFDPTSPLYSPGQRRVRNEHEHRSSYDN